MAVRGGTLTFAPVKRMADEKSDSTTQFTQTLFFNLKTLTIMAFYKKQFNEKFGVYYPTAIVVGQPVTTKAVAKRLSGMCTVTYADVMAVLGELPGVMADLMAQGKSVRLDGLGTFRLTLKTKGVAEEDDFDFQKQVRAVRVQFVPQREGAQTKGSVATRALVPGGIEWLAYDPSLEKPAGGTGTEPGGEDSGEDGGGGVTEDPLE